LGAAPGLRNHATGKNLLRDQVRDRNQPGHVENQPGQAAGDHPHGVVAWASTAIEATATLTAKLTRIRRLIEVGKYDQAIGLCTLTDECGTPVITVRDSGSASRPDESRTRGKFA
jgi:hypothetical protein